MIPLTKQLADFITWSRAFLALLIAWLGLTRGAEALPLVIILLIINWTADSIDGSLARRNPIAYHTWIGSHDLQIDMFVSIGTMGYLTTAGFLAWGVAAVYLLFWALYFWKSGIPHAMGVLFQAPTYGWFIYVSLRDAPQVGLWIVVWLIVAIAITWPKFPRIIVPGFLNGMQDILQKRDQ